MIHSFKVRKRAPHRIEIFVDRIEQLFNSMDPSPFHEKDLDHDAEEFIVSWAKEYPRTDPLTLIVHANQAADAAASQELVEKAVRNYFAYRGKLNRLEFKHLLKQGRTSLVIGLLFLAMCLLLSELMFHQRPGTFSSLMRESLTIAGWVAMWRPMQIFLYDWWPLLRVGHIYEKLSRVPVELRRPGAGTVVGRSGITRAGGFTQAAGELRKNWRVKDKS
jgi:hypothetical protein